MKRKLTGLIAATVAAMLLALAGCGKSTVPGTSSGGGLTSSGGSSSSGISGGSSEPGDSPGGEQQQAPAGEQNSGGGGAGQQPGGEGSGENAAEPVDTTGGYAEYVATEYKYRDIILNRKNIEGKLAIFFFRSDTEMHYFGGSDHSGDGTLLVAPDGTTMLVDWNLKGATGYIVDCMKKLGIKKIDFLVNSHPHSDHNNGFEAILDNFEIGIFYHPGNLNYYNDSADGSAPDFMKMIKAKGIKEQVLARGDSFAFGPATVRILYPGKFVDWQNNPPSPNDSSLVMRVDWKKASYLCAGDLEAGASVDWGECRDLLDVDVVKMNHHGYLPQNPSQWIEMLSPKIACGELSMVPDEGVIMNYTRLGAAAMHVAIDGTVLVTTAGDGYYDVQAEKDREEGMLLSSLIKSENGHFRVKAD